MWAGENQFLQQILTSSRIVGNRSSSPGLDINVQVVEDVLKGGRCMAGNPVNHVAKKFNAGRRDDLLM